jgi:hypothetical protein
MENGEVPVTRQQVDSVAGESEGIKSLISPMIDADFSPVEPPTIFHQEKLAN